MVNGEYWLGGLGKDRMTKVYDLINGPYVMAKARFHRRRYSESLMHSCKVVVHITTVQDSREFAVLDKVTPSF